MKTISKFLAVHYGVYAGGQAIGVNLSSQVFLGPAAYGGSPALSAVLSAPTAVADWSTQRGDMARTNVTKPIKTFVPGMLAAEGWYKHLVEGEPLMKSLGFPMNE